MQHIYKSSEYILSYFGGLIQIQTDIFYPILFLVFNILYILSSLLTLNMSNICLI